MGKMNNIALDLEELRKGASKLSEILATASEILITFNQIITSIESTFSSTPEKPKQKLSV